MVFFFPCSKEPQYILVDVILGSKNQIILLFCKEKGHHHIIYNPQKKKIDQKKFIPAFLCHGPLPFPTKPPFLPLSPQNPLNHASLLINYAYFENLDLHHDSSPKWSRNEFGSESALIDHRLGTTSWSMA